MRILATITGLVLLTFAGILSANAFSKELSLDELKARLQNAKPDERAHLCVEIAERQVEASNKLYTDGKTAEAEAAIHDVISYAQQAGESAGQTGHHLKNTEIAMRKMSHRLSDIKRTLPFEDQASVQSAVETLDKIGARGSHGVIVKAPDTDLVVKLCDVRPDGVSYNVIDEFLRLRWRDGVLAEVA